MRHIQQLNAVSYQPMTTTTGRSIVSRNKDRTAIEQIFTPSFDLRVDSSTQDLTPFLTNHETQKMGTAIERLPYIEKLATLTLRYLELNLPLPAAFRAAEADL
jgi:hypothetical protein